MLSDPCHACRGDGRVEVTREVEVKVPAGADTGLRLLVGGEGDAGQPGPPEAILNWWFASQKIPIFNAMGFIC